jgi:hypothetical protein
LRTEPGTIPPEGADSVAPQTVTANGEKRNPPTRKAAHLLRSIEKATFKPFFSYLRAFIVVSRRNIFIMHEAVFSAMRFILIFPADIGGMSLYVYRKLFYGYSAAV